MKTLRINTDSRSCSQPRSNKESRAFVYNSSTSRHYLACNAHSHVTNSCQYFTEISVVTASSTFSVFIASYGNLSGELTPPTFSVSQHATLLPSAWKVLLHLEISFSSLLRADFPFRSSLRTKGEDFLREKLLLRMFYFHLFLLYLPRTR